ncbi:NlpC/P60 family protein [Olivibacter sp. CPCC 100613]|uniref:C40 family peptidase n=1 Tax=Olivibacter sp. CPCC 100613 TaxID=3079931 RepID=UPI002FF52FE3
MSRKRGISPVLTHKNYHKKRGDILTDVSGRSGLYVSSGNLLADYANLLDVDARDLKNEKLYRFINDWIGTPYAYGGTTKNGVDCSGFAAMLMSEIYGKNLPRSSEDQADAIKRKYEKQLKEGDLVFFSFGSSRINHVGIYLHNGKFVHASTSKGVIISNLKDSWYYKSFKRAGTVK